MRSPFAARALCVVVLLAACGGAESGPAPTTALGSDVSPTATPPIEPATEAPPSVALPPAPADCRAATPEEAVAVAAAERFVAEQGYTEAAVPDDVEVLPEGIEAGSTRAEWIQYRHGLLEPRAHGVFPNAAGSPITVLFRYRTPDPDHPGTGRALVLASDASPHFVHQDAMLDHAVRLCPSGG